MKRRLARLLDMVAPRVWCLVERHSENSLMIVSMHRTRADAVISIPLVRGDARENHWVLHVDHVALLRNVFCLNPEDYQRLVNSENCQTLMR